MKESQTPKPAAAKNAAAAPAASAASCQSAELAAQSTQALASQLGKFITDNNLFNQFSDRPGKKYVRVEGWQYAGRLLGIVPIVESLLRVDPDSAPAACRYEAKVSLLDTRLGISVGAGFAICTDAEPGKKFYLEFAIASMAQTRAIGKAFRNSLAWLMREAGFEATPAEEMAYSAPAAALTQAPALATNGAAARVTVPTAQQLPAMHPALQSEATPSPPPPTPPVAILTATPVATNEQQPTMRVSSSRASMSPQGQAVAQAYAQAYAQALAAGTVFITNGQRELIIVLLNNVCITAGEKQKMLLNVNRVTAERAAESIVKLCQRITTSKGHLPADLEARLTLIEGELRAAEGRSRAMLNLSDFVKKHADYLGKPETDRLLTKCENQAVPATELLDELTAAREYLATMPAA